MPPNAPDSREEALHYVVELWHDVSRRKHDTSRGEIDRVLARASSIRLAREILKAAQAEHPDRRITLRKGTDILAESE